MLKKTGYWLLILLPLLTSYVYAYQEMGTSDFIMLLGIIFVGGILPFLGFLYIVLLIIHKLKQ